MLSMFRISNNFFLIKNGFVCFLRNTTDLPLDYTIISGEIQQTREPKCHVPRKQKLIASYNI